MPKPSYYLQKGIERYRSSPSHHFMSSVAYLFLDSLDEIDEEMLSESLPDDGLDALETVEQTEDEDR